MTRRNHNIVIATEDHVRHVARNLRKADRLEVEAIGFTPMNGLMLSYRSSLATWTLMWERPVAIFGIAGSSFFAETLSPWAVTTDDVNFRPAEFIRASHYIMKEYMRSFKHLYNLVDDRHVQSKRWLEHLGFKLHDPIPFGPHGVPFRPFEMRGIQ